MNRFLSRRDLLKGLGVAGIGSLVSGGNRVLGSETPDGITQLAENLFVYRGPINIGIVRDRHKALLIDCGDGRVVESFEDLGIEQVDTIAFTHHHRDQACGAYDLVVQGARLGVPTAERSYFDEVASYWNRPKSRWHLYNLHPHHLMLAESVPVSKEYTGGDTFQFGSARIRVLDTPGHTDGSISYLIEVDGRRVVFCGDAIYDEGQLWDIHSLQKGVTTTDYHGFLGARGPLVESLGTIKQTDCSTLVPSHGRIMNDPSKAIDLLVDRLKTCYDQYVAISGLRHYFPKMFKDYANKRGHMPIRSGKPVPDCLRHFGTTWMLVSQTKAALVMDCGSQRVVQTVQQMLDANEIRSVEGLWITHYHDDHVNAVPEFQKAFDCPTITDRHVAEVISKPIAWRLPCISPSIAKVDRATQDGQSWRWHEFRLTAYHLPGQTRYHAGLQVEGQGLNMFFVGDSFTMAGIDDYCSSNRNWLGRGVGFDRSIQLIDRLHPTHLFNCHVNEAFDFTREECRLMRENLARREKLFGQLVPWDHANFGMDEPWVRCFPYEQKASPNTQISLELVVTNHSERTQPTLCRPIVPRTWHSTLQRNTTWSVDEIRRKSEGHLKMKIPIPTNTLPGRYVIPIDVRFGRWTLPQITEAIVTVVNG